MGNRVIREIDAAAGRSAAAANANAGRICGIISTVLILGSSSLLLLVVVVFVAVAAGTSST